MNISSPKTKFGPVDVNIGIDGGQFDAKMSSTYKFVESLAKTGVGALMCKLDWRSAYKHHLKLQF